MNTRAGWHPTTRAGEVDPVTVPRFCPCSAHTHAGVPCPNIPQREPDRWISLCASCRRFCDEGPVMW